MYNSPCDTNGLCPRNYICNSYNQCQHNIFTLSFGTVIGALLISVVSGLSTLAGLGGGGPMLSILIIAFNYPPKTSTLLIFSLILGATFGNVINQATTLVNDKPMIKFRYGFLSIPIMFFGTCIGVLFNKFFPSIVVCLFIVVTTGSSIKKIYDKFKQGYKKETQQNLLSHGIPHVIQVKRTNVFNNIENVTIFRRLALLIFLFIFLQLIRGSQKFNSIIGVHRCSLSYWFIQFLMFLLMFLFARWNLKSLKHWQYNDSMLLREQQVKSPQIENKLKEILKGSILSGVYNGLGLGGGIFLVPMYKALELNPLQATASASFNIFITAIISTVQAIFIGAINIDELIFFFIFSAGGSFLLSNVISNELRKRNRLSIVELLLTILLILSVLNIPFGLIEKYIESGYDSQLIFGFGHIC